MNISDNRGVFPNPISTVTDRRTHIDVSAETRCIMEPAPMDFVVIRSESALAYTFAHSESALAYTFAHSESARGPSGFTSG